MRITIFTLFPRVFNDFTQTSIVGKLIKEKKISIEVVNFRQFAKDKRKKVDDYQYGGGGGMVLMAQPIVDAITKYRTKDSLVVLLTPQGKTYNQKQASKFSKLKHLILIAGHYEGFDERVLDYVDYELSVGDYVLMGGEVPAMVVVESISRLLDGAINQESLKSESFNDNLLDYPVYTKPLEFNGKKVPAILLSGDHKKIAAYRLSEKIKKTKIKRKDLYKLYLINNKNDKNK